MNARRSLFTMDSMHLSGVGPLYIYRGRQVRHQTWIIALNTERRRESSDARRKVPFLPHRVDRLELGVESKIGVRIKMYPRLLAHLKCRQVLLVDLNVRLHHRR